MTDNNDIDFLGGFIRFHRFVFRNAVPIIIFCVVGAGVGLIRHKVVEDVYRGDFVVLDGNCPKYLLKESLESVEYAINESNEDNVPAILSEVVEVKMDTNFLEAVKITVLVTEDSLPHLELESAIAGLLVHNKTLSGIMQEERGALDAQLKRMVNEQTTTKQIQQKILNATGDEGSLMGMHSLGQDMVKLNREIAKLERQLKRTGNYEVVRPLGRVENLKNSVIQELVFGTISGFFIGLLLCAYVSVLRRVRAS